MRIAIFENNALSRILLAGKRRDSKMQKLHQKFGKSA